MQEFEPFVRCEDSYGIDDARVWGLNSLCPKNTTRANPPSLDGQPYMNPTLTIIMTSCEEASNQPVLGMPDPEYCFNGERTPDMSDEDYLVLTTLRQHSNETFAWLEIQQQQVVLGDDDHSIS